MLVWFCIRAKLRAHTLKASLPCLPLPLHRPSPFLQPLQKNTYHLARSSRCTEYCHPPQPLQKNNNPSPRTTSLPCLPPLHRILLPSHLSFLFNILITANFNFAVNYIVGIVSFPPPLIFHLEPLVRPSSIFFPLPPQFVKFKLAIHN